MNVAERPLNHLLPCGHECDRPLAADAKFDYHTCKDGGAFHRDGTVAWPCLAADVGPEVHGRARRTWGFAAQVLALIEELNEAAAAAARLLNEKGTREELLEELVDVESLRLSVALDLGTPDEWAAVQQRKRRKLLAKLDQGVRRVSAGGA